MAYSFLQPASGSSNVPPPVMSATSRSRIFNREFRLSMRRRSFDELPLIDMASDFKSLNEHTSVPHVVAVDEIDRHAGSIYEIGKDNLDARSVDQSSLAESLRSWLNYTYRYIRSSGPARSPIPFEEITEDKGNRIPTGWRLGTWICCAAVILCIIFELALLAYLTATSSSRGSGILLEGNCKEVREVELWLLLPLNIAGTILIGTSNYVMQVVSAPERKDIDRAHASARSIAVGGVRFNDMTPHKGNALRRSIWWILGMSSLPIHFLLNVAVYSSVQASNTGVLVISDDFDSDSGWNYCSDLDSDATSTEKTVCSLYQSYGRSQMISMTTSQCLRQYSTGFQTNASSVIVVTNQDSYRWYTTPLTTEVPDSVAYGPMHCLAKFKECSVTYYNGSTGPGSCDDGYEETSNSLFKFTHSSGGGSTTISLAFIPCQNKTISGENGALPSSELVPIKRHDDWTYISHDDLFLQQSDALSNIPSIKALFGAFQYRYWAVADMSGDYLRLDYANLLGNRDPRAWLCPRSDLEKNRQCDPTELQRKNEWLITPNSMPVQECHVLPKKELCTLRYNSNILIITICVDLIKLSAMIAAVTLISRPLTTLGDIVESFLRHPDPYTEDCGVLDDDSVNSWTRKVEREIRQASLSYIRGVFKVDFHNNSICGPCGKRIYDINTGLINTTLVRAHRRCGKLPAGQSELTEFNEQAFEWLCEGGMWWTTALTEVDHHEPKALSRRRWIHVPSMSRWIWSILFYLSAISLAIAYFTINFRSLLAQGLRNPWFVGFDAPDPNSLLTGYFSDTTSIYTAAMLINAPQVAFSLLYFIFNATLTMMHAAHEWASFSLHRKALRVSSPRGQQRATYWLQLPWTYSIPLIILSGSMHWLLSRSLYVVKADVYGYLGEREMDKDYFACGYSPIPALLLVFVLGSMGATIFALSSRWLPGGMPLVRLNSLAIAAACHANPKEKNIELQPLMWGELEGYLKNGKPHYSFSAKQVIPLESRPIEKGNMIAMLMKAWPFKRKVSETLARVLSK